MPKIRKVIAIVRTSAGQFTTIDVVGNYEALRRLLSKYQTDLTYTVSNRHMPKVLRAGNIFMVKLTQVPSDRFLIKQFYI